MNTYDAALIVEGGPHPGFTIISANLYGGNGTRKDISGVNVGLGSFNGSNNNVPIPLTVGRNLAWAAQHSVTISINHLTDHYLSITVDNQTQDLTQYRLPRSFDGTSWLRGQKIEALSAAIIPDNVGGIQTDDDVHWDNFSLTETIISSPVNVSGTIALQGSTNSIQPMNFTFRTTTGIEFTRSATLNAAGAILSLTFLRTIIHCQSREPNGSGRISRSMPVQGMSSMPMRL